MATYFTSDTHYGHANVIKYCNRPFATVEQMDEELIYRHNNIVKHGDTIYHLGDFAMKANPQDYLRRLNGTIILVPGNHDNLSKWVHATSKVVHIAPQLHEISINGKFIIMCHYAMKTWNGSHYGSWMIHGHSHGSLPDDPNARICDVGVDNWDYAPVSFKQLEEHMNKKVFVPIDHHK